MLLPLAEHVSDTAEVATDTQLAAAAAEDDSSSLRPYTLQCILPSPCEAHVDPKGLCTFDVNSHTGVSCWYAPPGGPGWGSKNHGHGVSGEHDKCRLNNQFHVFSLCIFLSLSFSLPQTPPFLPHSTCAHRCEGTLLQARARTHTHKDSSLLLYCKSKVAYGFSYRFS
jgi:hypothetical protein